MTYLIAPYTNMTLNMESFNFSFFCFDGEQWQFGFSLHLYDGNNDIFACSLHLYDGDYWHILLLHALILGGLMTQLVFPYTDMLGSNEISCCSLRYCDGE